MQYSPRSRLYHAHRLPKREVHPSSGEDGENDETESAEGESHSRTSREQRAKPDWCVWQASALFLV